MQWLPSARSPAAIAAAPHGPESEVGKPGVKADLPPVPGFDLPPASTDSHSVKELRVKGRKLLGTELVVKATVTWSYDCPTAIRTDGETDQQVQARIDEDPTLCFRPKFYVGDSAQTTPEQSMWVVDVPRPYNKKEMERMEKQDRILPDRCEPKEDPKKNICPPYKVGDQVEITGKFQLFRPRRRQLRRRAGLRAHEERHRELAARPTAGRHRRRLPAGGVTAGRRTEQAVAGGSRSRRRRAEASGLGPPKIH